MQTNASKFAALKASYDKAKGQLDMVSDEEKGLAASKKKLISEKQVCPMRSPPCCVMHTRKLGTHSLTPTCSSACSACWLIGLPTSTLHTSTCACPSSAARTCARSACCAQAIALERDRLAGELKVKEEAYRSCAQTLIAPQCALFLVDCVTCGVCCLGLGFRADCCDLCALALRQASSLHWRPWCCSWWSLYTPHQLQKCRAVNRHLDAQ